MKRKRVAVVMALLSGVLLFSLPVSAKTSYLDVKAGDISSYYTYKDTGSQWENYYYVTPTSYTGKYIMGNSTSQNGKYGSGYTLLHKEASKYSYGTRTVPGGIYYRLETGPGPGTASNWHLVGRYTP